MAIICLLQAPPLSVPHGPSFAAYPAVSPCSVVHNFYSAIRGDNPSIHLWRRCLHSVSGVRLARRKGILTLPPIRRRRSIHNSGWIPVIACMDNLEPSIPGSCGLCYVHSLRLRFASAWRCLVLHHPNRGPRTREQHCPMALWIQSPTLDLEKNEP